MKEICWALVFTLLFCGIGSSGMLYGRIIKEDGSPLANTKIFIEDRKVITNEFGGYAIELPDGERELNVVINNTSYVSESVIIYSPKTKQNWRIEPREKRLRKIR